MKNKKIIILLPIMLLIIGGYSLIKLNSLKEINKADLKIDDYVNYVDEISQNKVQVNWKYVAAIIGVIEKNDLKDVSSTQIKEIGNMFIKENDNSYKLNPISTVLDKLQLKEKDKKMVYDYIDDLEHYGLTPSRLHPDTKYMKFINSIKNGAIKNYRKYKILPSITIAQAILETGWGESDLASEYNNLFGIKADKSWTGEYVTLETIEYKDTNIKDKFRKYENMEDSIIDHGRFLYENKRYSKSGIFDANTYIHQANALQSAGYSTLINENGEKIYASKLINLIQQYNLQIIDNEAQNI